MSRQGYTRALLAVQALLEGQVVEAAVPARAAARLGPPETSYGGTMRNGLAALRPLSRYQEQDSARHRQGRSGSSLEAAFEWNE